MDNEEFMESMKSTWKKAGGPYAHFQKDDLAHAVIGLSAEAGELLDEFKKWRFYNDGRSFPQKRLEDELGDVLYYVFAVCNELNVKPEDIMFKNRNKLRERYAITSKLPPNCSWANTKFGSNSKYRSNKPTTFHRGSMGVTIFTSHLNLINMVVITGGLNECELRELVKILQERTRV